VGNGKKKQTGPLISGRLAIAKGWQVKGGKRTTAILGGFTKHIAPRPKTENTPDPAEQKVGRASGYTKPTLRIHATGLRETEKKKDHRLHNAGDEGKEDCMGDPLGCL